MRCQMVELGALRDELRRTNAQVQIAKNVVEVIEGELNESGVASHIEDGSPPLSPFSPRGQPEEEERLLKQLRASEELARQEVEQARTQVAELAAARDSAAAGAAAEKEALRQRLQDAEAELRRKSRSGSWSSASGASPRTPSTVGMSPQAGGDGFRSSPRRQLSKQKGKAEKFASSDPGIEVPRLQQKMREHEVGAEKAAAKAAAQLEAAQAAEAAAQARLATVRSGRRMHERLLAEGGASDEEVWPLQRGWSAVMEGEEEQLRDEFATAAEIEALRRAEDELQRELRTLESQVLSKIEMSKKSKRRLEAEDELEARLRAQLVGLEAELEWLRAELEKETAEADFARDAHRDQTAEVAALRDELRRTNAKLEAATRVVEVIECELQDEADSVGLRGSGSAVQGEPLEGELVRRIHRTASNKRRSLQAADQLTQHKVERARAKAAELAAERDSAAARAAAEKAELERRLREAENALKKKGASSRFLEEEVQRLQAALDEQEEALRGKDTVELGKQEAVHSSASQRLSAKAAEVEALRAAEAEAVRAAEQAARERAEVLQSEQAQNQEKMRAAEELAQREVERAQALVAELAAVQDSLAGEKAALEKRLIEMQARANQEKVLACHAHERTLAHKRMLAHTLCVHGAQRKHIRTRTCMHKLRSVHPRRQFKQHFERKHFEPKESSG